MCSWGDKLVEWCNCLQLGCNIKKINELKNNDFFKNVFSILKKSDSPSDGDCSFFQILSLLNNTYKYAQIDDIRYNSLKEIPEERLIIITSLLMHYTCMYDGRDDFTLPLCQNLSKKTQLSIKDFLQSVNKEVAYSDLEELIGQDRTYANDESKPILSPLTAVFKTPSLKRKYNYEKDRAVTKLKTALELEQYERADLEEDLKLQIEKTQKFEKLLNKRNDEIISLKSEIFKLKCQTPPQYSKKPDSEHTVKLLRKELENFEQYIVNNEKEHEQLREEHYLYKKKIEEYEVEYAQLQEKYLLYNEQIDDLTEMLNDKSKKIVHLETYCEELKEILDGYKHQKPSWNEISFSEFVPSETNKLIVNPENLASTVVEIQLKEAQELNEELLLKVNNLSSELASTKKYLDSQLEENSGIQKKLNAVSTKLFEYKQDFYDMKKYLKLESNEYKMSLSFLEREINNVLTKQSTSINNITAENLQEKENNKTLSLQVTKLEQDLALKIIEKEHCMANLESLENTNKALSEKIKILETIIENNKSELKELNFENEKWKNEIDILNKSLENRCTNIALLQDVIELNKTKISQLLGEKKEYVHDISIMKQRFEDVNRKSEEYLKKITILEDTIKEKEEKMLSERNEYVKQIEYLNGCNNLLTSESESYATKLKILEEKIEDNRTELDEFHSKVIHLQEENAGLKLTNRQLNSKLEECNGKVDDLNSEIKQYIIKLRELYSIKDEHMHELEDFKNENGQLRAKSEEYCSQIQTLSDTGKRLEMQLSEIDLEKEKIIAEKDIIQKENYALKMNSEESCEKMKHLEQTIKDYEINLSNLDLKCKEYSKEIEVLQQLNQCQKEKSEKSYLKIESLKSELEKNKIEIDQLQSEKFACLKKNEDLNVENNALRENIDGYCKDVGNLKITICENMNELEKLRSESKCYENENKNLKQQNNILLKETEEQFKRVSFLEDMVEKGQIELKEKEEFSVNMEKKMKSVENQCRMEKMEDSKNIQILQENLIEKEKEIDLKESLLKSFRNTILKCFSEMKNIKRDLEGFKKCCLKEKNTFYELMESLKKSNAQLEKSKDNIIDELKVKLSNEQTDNDCLKNKISDWKNQLLIEREKHSEELRKDRIDLENSKRRKNEISNDMTVLEDRYNGLKSENDELLSEIENQKVTIQEMGIWKSDCQRNVTENIKLKNLLVNYESSLEKFELFKKYMKRHVDDLKDFHKKEFHEYNEMIINLKQTINCFTSRLIECDSLRNEVVRELDDCKKSKSSALMEVESLKAEIVKINSDWAEDKEQQKKLMIENQTHKDNFVDFTKTVKLFNEEIDKIVRTLKERKNKSDIKLNDLHRVYKEMNTGDLLKTPEKKKINDISFEVNKLGEQISKLNVYMDIFLEKETFYLKELETLKEELAASNSSRFDVVESLKEQISDNEHQISTQTENLHTIVEKYNQLHSENQEYTNQIKKYEEELKNVVKEHSVQMNMKELKITKLLEENDSLEKEITALKQNHNRRNEESMEKILTLEKENSKNREIIEEYKSKIMYLEAQIAILREEMLKSKTGKTEEEYETMLAGLQVQVVRNKLEITELKRKKEEVISENETLACQVDMLQRENEEELRSHQELQDQCKKYEEENSHKKFLEEKLLELSQKVETLMKSIEIQKDSYEVLKIYYKNIKVDFDKLLSQKNSLENLTNNIKIQMASVNRNILFVNSTKFLERKEVLDVISDDIIKQYSRYSKHINEITQAFVVYFERNCDNIFASLDLKMEDFSTNHNIHELSDQISDLTDRAADLLEQIKSTQKDIEYAAKHEQEKMEQKENILTTSRKINIEKIKDDDLKKKNIALKQKVTLLENTKNNMEKTVKKLREENKKLKENDNSGCIENEVHYKLLVQEYIAYKEDQEKTLKKFKTQLEDLKKEYEEHKNNCMRSSTPIENKFFSKSGTEKELEKLQEAFSKIRIDNEKLEGENAFLKQLVGAHKEEMGKFTSIKEAYDKLLEENNKLMTEVDTIKYKRARDRDEFLRWLKKERSENDLKNSKQIQNIKAEYELKLERMKDKMIKLYREEVNKEMSKIKGKQHESSSLLKTVEQLECELFEAKQKIQLLNERETRRTLEQNALHQMHSSNSQLHDVDSLSLRDFPLSCINSTCIDSKPRNSIAKLMEFKHPNKVNPSSLDTRRQYEERQVKTLPRSGTIVEEVNMRRQISVGVPNSIGNLQMEDEEEMFNNKYLTDLKQGKCEISALPEDRDSRVSELAWRNSLVPPHLKSSYPAETQFCSPERFREDDIKAGAGGFDDSSSKLLPNEKRKKDFGTTSYKKPGPPTPSKNGGRLSLTGSEMHVSKDQNSESKKSTPGRIRSLFTGKSSSRSSIEPSASPKKRLSIFRR